VTTQASGAVTRLLRAWSDGEEDALQQLTPLVEAELRRLARGYMARERRGHTLQPTALVNEAFVRLTDARGIPWQDAIDIVALDRALEALAAVDVRKSRTIELRFFGGLSVEETGEVLHVSADTVKRDWRLAKLWLLRELGGDAQ